MTETPQGSLHGVTENIGIGGVGVVSDRLPPLNGVLRCEISLMNDLPGIPTLVQLRWARKIAGRRQYKLGFQFLL